jgi:hypothetical protein
MVKAGSSTPPTPTKATKPENRLKRSTPFISNIRFRTSLPEVSASDTAGGTLCHICRHLTLRLDQGLAASLQVPCDPKMLVAVLQPDKLSQFNITTLEQDMRQDLILESGVGIPLSLLDTQRYAVPDVIEPLAPEDAALVMVRKVECRSVCLLNWQMSVRMLTWFSLVLKGPATEEGSGAVKTRERLRGEGAELSWLMRTTYIANEMEERRQQRSAEKPGTADGQGDFIDRDAQIAAIEVLGAMSCILLMVLRCTARLGCLDIELPCTDIDRQVLRKPGHRQFTSEIPV